jgi:hypothetical protein
MSVAVAQLLSFFFSRVCDQHVSYNNLLTFFSPLEHLSNCQFTKPKTEKMWKTKRKTKHIYIADSAEGSIPRMFYLPCRISEILFFCLFVFLSLPPPFIRRLFSFFHSLSATKHDPIPHHTHTHQTPPAKLGEVDSLFMFLVFSGVLLLLLPLLRPREYGERGKENPKEGVYREKAI